MFGIRLRTIRKSQKISQTQLAKAIGTNRRTIISWENGRTLPKAGEIVRLCKCLHISSDYLLGLCNRIVHI
ncbi:MAG TPA: helix-turn-helix transcriptional regulator [Candidatus Merdivicinus intestinavium]|nr:helix-turn-helix transcriptional regulator [Candidatus Merdivicinus intestinavium]